MNPTEHIGNEYDAMVGEQQEHEEVKNETTTGSATIILHGRATTPVYPDRVENDQRLI